MSVELAPKPPPPPSPVRERKSKRQRSPAKPTTQAPRPPALEPKRRRGRPPTKSADGTRKRQPPPPPSLPELPAVTAEQHAKTEGDRQIRERLARLAWFLENRACGYLEDLDDDDSGTEPAN